MTMKSPEKQNPVVNRISSHTYGSTSRTRASVPADAVVASAANEHELRAYAHSIKVAKAIQAIEEGLDGLVHVPAVAVEPDERGRLASLMVSEGIAAATTLTTFDSLIELLASQESQEEVTALRGLYDEMEMSLARLAEEDAGLLVLGTDSPHLPPGAAYHREIELVSEAGMTPGQIVMAATRDAARYMGLGDELGTVELGKLADLIVVEGDPLQDPSALREVVVVIKGGEIVAGGGE